jgi:hypothetical protein
MDPARVDEVMHRIDEGFAELIAEEPGFIAYQVLDCGEGNIATLTTSRDREGAENSIAMAAAWVRDELSDVDIQRVDAHVGEAKVSRAIAEMLEPAHA